MNYMNNVRCMDMDDIMIMAKFADGKKPSEIARELRISISAISHRTNKIKSIFGQDIFDGFGIKKTITEKGAKVFNAFKEVMQIIESLNTDDKI